MTKTKTYKTNKQTRSTQTSSLFPKFGDHNAKKNEETREQRARETFKDEAMFIVWNDKNTESRHLSSM